MGSGAAVAEEWAFYKELSQVELDINPLQIVPLHPNAERGCSQAKIGPELGLWMDK